MLIALELFDQINQLRVLIVQTRKFNLCCLFLLADLFDSFRGLLAICLRRFQIVIVRLGEVSQALVPDLLTVFTDAEFTGPSSDLVLRLL